nr:copia protein [Tanacetum cinerariifolium]
MQKEVNQFYRNKVWTLVPLPYGKTAIGFKWVFKNKKDEHGITTKNKARLFAQGYSQEEGIDYDETFAPVARMEATGIFLAFATYMNFKVYQIDVKSTFLNGKLKEEVYVKQPSGFNSSEFPDYVCKLDKALNGLKQVPRAWMTNEFPFGKKSTLAEAEYVAVAGCCLSILWMKSQLSDYDIHYKMVPIFCDNTSAIAISNNLFLYSRTKHNDIRYHFIRDDILKGDIELHFTPTEYQLADIFTKPMDEPAFTRLKAKSRKQHTPHPERPLRDKDSEGNKPPIDMEPQTNPDDDLSGTDVQAFILSEDEMAQESDEEVFEAGEEMEQDT